MYKQKLVLADDEPITLQAIQTVIENNCPGVEIIRTFRNGRDAIEYIRNNAVDIVVTDIRMPLADGLEILKYVYNHHQNIKVMIITGFKDFEYAHSAISYGASALLTKPLDYEELIDKITKFCRQNEQDMLKALGDTQALLSSRDRQRQDLFLYFEQVLSYSVLCERYPDLAQYEKQCFIVDLKSDRALPSAAWQDICEISNNYLNSFCLLKNERAATLLLLIRPNNTTQAKMHISLYLNDIKNIIEKSYSVAVTLQTTGYGALQEIHTNQKQNDLHNAAGICLQYVMGTMDKRTMLAAFHSSGFAQQKQIFSQVLQELQDSFSLSAVSFVKQLGQIESTRELLSLLKMVKHFVQTQKDYDLLRIKNYIYLHCDQDLNLETVASAFGMNYSYLSRMFKEKSGENVSQYITKIRIARAKKLLLSGRSLEETARTIGYDAAYLVKKFKKETGITPNQYVERENAKQNT